LTKELAMKTSLLRIALACIVAILSAAGFAQQVQQPPAPNAVATTGASSPESIRKVEAEK
jgi:hypothetical protein